MIDRELLEFAAKAARIECEGGYYWTSTGEAWNPLTDDGDALRLAVKLKIDICPSMSGQTKFSYAWKDGSSYAEVSDDLYAATRRAIVRAAAEIGRSMK